MKSISLGVAALMMLLVGCVSPDTLTPEEQAKRDAIIKLTIERIERDAAISIDLSELPKKKLRALDISCFGAMIGALSLDLDPSRFEKLSAICDRIAEALIERT